MKVGGKGSTAYLVEGSHKEFPQELIDELVAICGVLCLMFDNLLKLFVTCGMRTSLLIVLVYCGITCAGKHDNGL